METNLKDGLESLAGQEANGLGSTGDGGGRAVATHEGGAGRAAGGGMVVEMKSRRAKRQVVRFKPGSPQARAAAAKVKKRVLTAQDRMRERIRKRLLAIVMEEMKTTHGNMRGRRQDARDKKVLKDEKGTAGVDLKETTAGKNAHDGGEGEEGKGSGNAGIDFGNLKIVYGLLLQDEAAAWARERVLLEEARGASGKLEVTDVTEMQRVIRLLLGKEVEV